MSGNSQENRFAVLDSDSGDGTVPPLNDELGKELVSLLKSQPKCSMELKKFSALYELHRGKTFNVKEHGHTKLKDLFMALPHIVTVYQTETITRSSTFPSTHIKLKPNYEIDTAPEVSQVERLDILSRELTVLLKSEPECSIPIGKLFGKYKYQFGKNLNSSLKDIGFKKLKDLIEAMPQTVQIVGSGPEAHIKLSKVVNEASGGQGTKSKRALMKEGSAIFRKELTKLLESQPGHSIPIGQFGGIFEKHFGKKFKLEEYGYTNLHMLISTMPETVLIVGKGSKARLQSQLFGASSEIAGPTLDKSTRKFANDCIELLTLAPEGIISFDKFVPRYHQYCGRQLKLSDYGFEKLIDLFKAVPDTVEVAECGNADRPIKLKDNLLTMIPNESAKTEPKDHVCSNTTSNKLKHKLHLKLFSMELVELLKSQSMCYILMSSFGGCYEQHFGKKFNVKEYGYTKLKPIFESLPAIVQIVGEGGGIGITLADSHAKESEELQYKEEGTLQFAQECTKIFGTEERKQEFAEECSELLMNMPDYKITLKNFEEKYYQHFGRLCRPPSDFGFNDMHDLFEAMPDTIKVIGSANYAEAAAVGSSIQLTESTVLSNVELPLMQNDMRDLDDVTDVKDEEKENEADPKDGGEEDKEHVKGASVKPLGSLSQNVKRFFGLFTKK